MSILNGLDVRKIINSNPFEQNIIALTSNLEAILQNVSKDALEDFGCKNINELTLRQLGRIYTSVLYKNDGIYGICWEYGIYKFLLYGDDYVHSIFNDAINKLTCETGDESIDVILWGGERNSLDVEAILSSLDTPLINIFSTKAASLNLVPGIFSVLESTSTSTLCFFAISTDLLFKT